MSKTKDHMRYMGKYGKDMLNNTKLNNRDMGIFVEIFLYQLPTVKIHLVLKVGTTKQW